MQTITNRSPGPRGFCLIGGGRATLAPGESRDLRIDPLHPVHVAWARAGEIGIVLPPEPHPSAAGEGEGEGAAASVEFGPPVPDGHAEPLAPAAGLLEDAPAGPGREAAKGGRKKG